MPANFKTLDELKQGMPADITHDAGKEWLKAANATVEAAVGLIATREQMKAMTSDQWHALKDNPHQVSDLVRAAHVAFRERFG